MSKMIIYKIENTSELSGVYLEDTDTTANTVDECYMVQKWYNYYFSTLEAAIEEVKSFGMDYEVRTAGEF